LIRRKEKNHTDNKNQLHKRVHKTFISNIKNN